MAKLSLSIISNIVCKAEHYVKYSCQFHEFIRLQEVPEGYGIVSFDVKSSYTSIPVKVIADSWSKIAEKTCLPKADIMEDIKFYLVNTYFQFENSFF